MAEITMSAADVDRLAEPIAERVRELLADHLRDLGRLQTAAPEIVTRERLAEILGVSVVTIDRRVKAGLIPSIGDEHTRRFVVSRVLDAMTNETVPKNERGPRHD